MTNQFSEILYLGDANKLLVHGRGALLLIKKDLIDGRGLIESLKNISMIKI